MTQRIALWALVAVLVAIGAIAIWQGLPLSALEESRYYFLTAILFFASAAWTALRGLKAPGEGLVSGAAAGFAAFLLAISSYLCVKGGQLVSIGGSPYYVLTGAALILVAVLLMLRSVWSARLYAAVVGVTVVWSLLEAGLDFWPLLARLAAFLVVGLWFFAPWTRAHFQTPAKKDLPRLGYARWNLGAWIAGAAVLVMAAFQGWTVEPGSKFATSAGPGVADWRNYGGPTLGTRFVELDQINTGSV
jgi:glucose dehydrogenase